MKFLAVLVNLFCIGSFIHAQVKEYESIDLLVQNRDNDKAISELRKFVEKKNAAFPLYQLGRLYHQKALSYLYQDPERCMFFLDSSIYLYNKSLVELSQTQYKKFSGYFAREMQTKAPGQEAAKDFIYSKIKELYSERDLCKRLYSASQNIKELYTNQVEVYNQLIRAPSSFHRFVLALENEDLPLLESLQEMSLELKKSIAAYRAIDPKNFSQNFQFVSFNNPFLIKNLDETFAQKNVYLADLGTWAELCKKTFQKIPIWKLQFSNTLKRLDSLSLLALNEKNTDEAVADETFYTLLYELQSLDHESPLAKFLLLKRDITELLFYHNDFYTRATDPRNEESYRKRLMDILLEQSSLAISRIDSLLNDRSKIDAYEALIEPVFNSISAFWDKLEADYRALNHRISTTYQSGSKKLQKEFYRLESFEYSNLITFSRDNKASKGAFFATHGMNFADKSHIVGGYYFNEESNTLDAFVCSLEKRESSQQDSTAKIFWLRKFNLFIEGRASDDKVTEISVNNSGISAFSLLSSSLGEYECRLAFLGNDGEILLNQEISNSGMIRIIRPASDTEFLVLIKGNLPEESDNELEKCKYLKINTKGEIIYQNVFTLKGHLCAFFPTNQGAYVFLNFLDFADNRMNRPFVHQPFYRSAILDMDKDGFIRKAKLLFDGKPSYIFEVEKISDNQFYATISDDIYTQSPKHDTSKKIRVEIDL